MPITTIFDTDFLKLDMENSGMPDTLPLADEVAIRWSWGFGYNVANKKWLPVLVNSDGRLLVSSEDSPVSSINQSKVATSTSNALVLASNSDRKQFVIQNVGTSDVYLSFSSDDATTDDFLLVAGATWIENQYFGAVNSIMAAGTSDLRVAEYS